MEGWSAEELVGGGRELTVAISTDGPLLEAISGDKGREPAARTPRRHEAIDVGNGNGLHQPRELLQRSSGSEGRGRGFEGFPKAGGRRDGCGEARARAPNGPRRFQRLARSSPIVEFICLELGHRRLQVPLERRLLEILLQVFHRIHALCGRLVGLQRQMFRGSAIVQASGRNPNCGNSGLCRTFPGRTTTALDQGTPAFPASCGRLLGHSVLRSGRCHDPK
mmetsp:Transcript_48671/g.136072  ORF Transcript_48671/g.136072 Transcript_48671/m.136072 type:complete len:222 (-) Transcript_48671:242-907(-)